MAEVEYNIRAFKNRTSIVNPAHIITSVSNSSHYKTTYSHWEGSNYELAEIVSDNGRPFMLFASKLLSHNTFVREELKSELKYYISATDEGLYVDWYSFSQRCENTIRDLLINDQLGLMPLAPMTLYDRNRKGVSGETPLVATGQLADAIITYVERD